MAREGAGSEDTSDGEDHEPAPWPPVFEVISPTLYNTAQTGAPVEIISEITSLTCGPKCKNKVVMHPT